MKRIFKLRKISTVSVFYAISYTMIAVILLLLGISIIDTTQIDWPVLKIVGWVCWTAYWLILLTLVAMYVYDIYNAAKQYRRRKRRCRPLQNLQSFENEKY